MPAATPIATRPAGWIQPLSNAYFRKKPMPTVTASAPMRLSHVPPSAPSSLRQPRSSPFPASMRPGVIGVDGAGAAGRGGCANTGGVAGSGDGGTGRGSLTGVGACGPGSGAVTGAKPRRASSRNWAAVNSRARMRASSSRSRRRLATPRKSPARGTPRMSSASGRRRPSMSYNLDRRSASASARFTVRL